MSEQWRAVVFDLDDTLYPERHYVRSGMAAVAAWAQSQFGYAADTVCAELWQLFQSGVRGDTFQRWLTARGQDPQRHVPAMVEVYRCHWPSIRAYPDVPPVLAALRGRGRLGLLSDGYLAVQQQKLEALGLGPFFHAVVFSDALGRDAWKPCERPYQAVLGLLAVPPPQTIYVADNPLKDFRGARAVGMATARIRRPDGLYREIEPRAAEDAADFEITDLHAFRTSGFPA